MRLHWDLDLGYLVRTPGTDIRLVSLEFKRGDATTLDLLFYRSGVSVLLGAGFDIRFALKEKNRYDADPVVYTASFTEDTNNKTYTARPSLNTTELNALLQVDNTNSNDLASVELAGEVSYRIGSNSDEWLSTQTLKVTVHNDVVRGEEGTPTTAQQPDNYLTKDRVIEYLPLIVGLTGGGSTKLDGVASPALPLGKLVALVDNSTNPAVLRTYELDASTAAESSPDVIRPDDYNATTNARVWRLRAPSAGNAVRYDASQGLNGSQQLTARSNIGAAARYHAHRTFLEALVFAPESQVSLGTYDLFMLPDLSSGQVDFMLRLGSPANDSMAFQIFAQGPSNGWGGWNSIGMAYIDSGQFESSVVSASLNPGDMIRLEVQNDGSGYYGGPAYGLYAFASIFTSTEP